MNGNDPYEERTRVIQINKEDLMAPAVVSKPKPACLVSIYAGGDLGKKHDLHATVITIGRSASCNIVVNDESVSRLHCELRLNADGTYVVRDNGATNGTMINDVAIAGIHPITDRDFLKCGGVIFKFLSGDNIETDYYEEIYRLTTVDGLTQVFNKRYFMESLEREMSRARRYGRELSLIMFDIDHFKAVNDTYGHLAGDYVLRKLAAAISRTIRREDIFARYGGEEFSIILPEIGLDNALYFADKIRGVVEVEPFLFENNMIPITISIGVSLYHPNMRRLEDFILVADDFLYSAKDSGRNCVKG
jgi:diguanylate cyclase (GGDEF)-like protein